MTMNTNAPNGLQPYGMFNGSPYSGATNEYLISTAYGTALYNGDPVTMSAGYLAVGVAGSAIIGVFQGVKYIDGNGVAQFKQNWPASTVTLAGSVITALVIDDPMVVFSIQETNASGVAGTPLTQATGPGFNFNFLYTAGTAATGQSKVSLNNASSGTTANLKVLRGDPTINNAVGTSFCNWLVIINNDVFKGGTGTAALS